MTETNSNEEDLLTDLCLLKLSILGAVGAEQLFSTAQGRFESDFKLPELSSVTNIT